MRASLLTLIAGSMLGLAACSNPLQMEGGPCKYETSTVTAKAIAIHDETVEFEDELETFFIRKSAFKTLPAIGEKQTFKKDSIIKGTCTPSMYAVVSDED